MLSTFVDLFGRDTYRADALLDVSPRSAYWYRNGIEWRAFGAWAIAIVLGFCFLSIGEHGFHGPLADTWLGRNRLGWIVTFVIGGGLYALLGGARRTQGLQESTT